MGAGWPETGKQLLEDLQCSPRDADGQEKAETERQEARRDGEGEREAAVPLWERKGAGRRPEQRSEATEPSCEQGNTR